MASTPTVPPLSGKKVAILGAGKMGGILLQAFLKSKMLAAGADSRHRRSMKSGQLRSRHNGE